MYEVYRGPRLVARFKQRQDAIRFVAERGPGLQLVPPEPPTPMNDPFPRVETVPYGHLSELV